MTKTRREFISSAGMALAAIPAMKYIKAGGDRENVAIKTDQDNAARKAVSLNIRDFGAHGDGSTKDTGAIQQAIDRCCILGGGEVLVPPGNYLTGALNLKSNVVLRLDKDSVIKGSPDFSDYPVTQVRWEGKWIQGHTALIYAFDAENIGISGPGKISGNHALGGRPDIQNPLRHPALIEPINCKNILFEEFTTDYFLMWSIHPTYCENINIRNLTVRNAGGNGDGIDIDSCRHVRIDNCDISTGDDCIAIKSGRGMEGYTLLRTTEDVEITNCTFSDSIFACIGIGSETSGGIRDVRIKNCRFIAAKTYAIYIKSRPGRGAFIEDISADGLDVSGMQGGFLRINILNSGIQDQEPVPGTAGIPTIKNFSFSNVKVNNVPVLVDATAIHPDKPLQGLLLSDISGTCRRGISLANVRDARLKRINVTGYNGPLTGIFNVTGKGLKGAAVIEGPKVPDPIMPPGKFYLLK